MKSNKNSQGNNLQKLNNWCERMNVERAFGVLQTRFSMVMSLTRFWDKDNLWYIMTVVIMHNIIIENEQNANDNRGYDYDQRWRRGVEGGGTNIVTHSCSTSSSRFKARLRMGRRMNDFEMISWCICVRFM